MTKHSSEDRTGNRSNRALAAAYCLLLAASPAHAGLAPDQQQQINQAVIEQDDHRNIQATPAEQPAGTTQDWIIGRMLLGSLLAGGVAVASLSIHFQNRDPDEPRAPERKPGTEC